MQDVLNFITSDWLIDWLFSQRFDDVFKTLINDEEEYFLHSHKKRKDSLKTPAVLLTLLLEREISGVAVPIIHQKWRLLWGIAQWKWLWSYFNYFLLLWPWCQGFWGTSEGLCRSKICKCTLCAIISWIAKIYLSIDNGQKMVDYKDTSDVTKKAVEVAQKKEQ